MSRDRLEARIQTAAESVIESFDYTGGVASRQSVERLRLALRDLDEHMRRRIAQVDRVIEARHAEAVETTQAAE